MGTTQAGEEGAAVAGGGRLALWASEEELSATQTGACQAGDSPGNRASLKGGIAKEENTHRDQKGEKYVTFSIGHSCYVGTFHLRIDSGDADIDPAGPG